MAKNVGFIGLGAMGYPQARRILLKHSGLATLAVFDVDAAKAEKFASEATDASKVVICATPEEVVALSEVTFTMLPNPAASQEVYATVAGKIALGKTIVECSTAGSKTVTELAKIVQDKGGVFVDSPVSGGVQGAEAGTLTFIVGTSDSPSLEDRQKMALDSLLVLTTPHLDAVRPLLACMASNIFHAGPIGAGQVVKLANNNLIYIHQLALSLSLLSGSKHGVPPALLSAIINTSTGRSFMSTNWNPDPDSVPGSSAPAKNGYVIPPGFPVFGAVKDISLGKEMGELVGVENPLVRETLKVFEAASRSGEHKGLDFSSVYRWLADNLSRI